MKNKVHNRLRAGARLLLLLSLPHPLAAVEMDLFKAETLALEASKEINRAAEQTAISSCASRLAVRKYLPQLEINYSRSRQIDYYAADADVIQLGLNINQPVFNGGRNMRTAALKNINSALAAAALEEQKSRLKKQVFQLFYGILLNREKLSIQKELLEISNTRLEITEKKHSFGEATELECIEASIELQNIRLEILDTECSMKIQLRDFAMLTGYPPRHFEENPLTLTGAVDCSYQGLQLKTADSILYDALAQVRNISIRELKAELVKRRTELDISCSTFLPGVSLQAALNIRGTRLPLQDPGFSVSLQFDFPDVPSPLKITNAAGVQDRSRLSFSTASGIDILPDFDFFVTKKQAALLLKQASDRLADAQTSLTLSIGSALEELEHKRIRIGIKRNTLRLLESKMKILETRSRMGEVREPELLQARINFCGEEISILEDVMELMTAEIEFASLIGISAAELYSISESVRRREDAI